MSDNIHIGFDAKRFFNNRTGLGNYSRTLLSNLARFFPGNSYVLYTPKLNKNQLTAPLFQAPYQVVSPAINYPFWRSQRISRRLHKDNIQIYHGLSHELPRGPVSDRVRQVVTIHDLIFKIYPETYKPVDRWLYERKFSHAIRQSDLIVAISEQTKHDILKFYPETPESKIEVHYQACDPIFYEEMTMEEAREKLLHLNLPNEFILSVGSIIPRKNLVNLIKAHALLSADEQIPIVVVGKGKGYWRKVQSTSRRLGLANKLIHLSIEETRLLQALYMRATVLVYPSLYEGFGLPVVEAMLCGTPVVTSNLSSLKEAGKPCVLVPPDQVEAIAQGISRAIQMRNDAEHLAKVRQDTHSRFHPEVLTNALMNSYRALIT